MPVSEMPPAELGEIRVTMRAAIDKNTETIDAGFAQFRDELGLTRAQARGAAGAGPQFCLKKIISSRLLHSGAGPRPAERTSRCSDSSTWNQLQNGFS